MVSKLRFGVCGLDFGILQNWKSSCCGKRCGEIWRYIEEADSIETRARIKMMGSDAVPRPRSLKCEVIFLVFATWYLDFRYLLAS
jgi:hypothetical protein